MPRPSEAETEAGFINPILACLDWEHRRSRNLDAAENTSRTRPVPRPGNHRESASLRSVDRFRSAQSSSRTRRKTGRSTVPTAAAKLRPTDLAVSGPRRGESGGLVRWGLLTNGRFWRLYWAQARARAEGFVEIDLRPWSAIARPAGLRLPVFSARRRQASLAARLHAAVRRDALIPQGRGHRAFSIAPSTKAAFTNNASPKRCRAPFGRSFPSWSRRSARRPPSPRPNDPSLARRCPRSQPAAALSPLVPALCRRSRPAAGPARRLSRVRDPTVRDMAAAIGR